MTPQEIQNLPTEAKKSLLKAIASGYISKEDLKNKETLTLLTSSAPLVKMDLGNRVEFYFNGAPINEADFNRLSTIREVLGGETTEVTLEIINPGNSTPVFT